MLLESLLEKNKNLELMPINDIVDDKLYDALIMQSQQLKNQEDISFNGSLYSVIFNPLNGVLAAACWLEDNGSLFSPHFIVFKEFRYRGLFTKMLLDCVDKYNKIKTYRHNYPMIVNAINPEITTTLLKHGFKQYKGESYIYQS